MSQNCRLSRSSMQPYSSSPAGPHPESLSTRAQMIPAMISARIGQDQSRDMPYTIHPESR